MKRSIGFCGRYELTVKKIGTNKIVRKRSFSNVITNAGMMAMRVAASSGSSLTLNWCYVGTGTNTPSVTDTTMGALARTFGTQGQVTITAPIAPDYVTKKHMTYRMAAGNPGNYSEVGVGWNQNPQGALYSRALILDEYGNPSTITVLPDEYMDVIYTVEGHPSLEDLTGTFVLNGVRHTVVSRLAYGTRGCFFGGYRMSAPFASGIAYVYESQVLGSVTAYPQGTPVNAAVSKTSCEVLGDENTYGVRSVIPFGLNNGNTPGGKIGALAINPGGLGNDTEIRTQMSFDPPIPKTNNNTLTLTFEQWFGRHTT